MTDSTNYVTIDELRAYTKDTGSRDETIYQDALNAAQRQIDGVCGRFFYKTTSATAKYFWPDTFSECCTDDFWTSTGLLVDVDVSGNGTYSQSWTLSTDFFLEPLNGTQGGIQGWPNTKLSATFSSKYFPMRQTYLYMRPTVRVTAQWGWAAVPEAVKQATKIAATKLYKLSDAPLGYSGFEAGVVKVRDIPEVMSLLEPFAQDEYVVA